MQNSLEKHGGCEKDRDRKKLEHVVRSTGGRLDQKVSRLHLVRDSSSGEELKRGEKGKLGREIVESIHCCSRDEVISLESISDLMITTLTH
jgi:hypothetical protein